MANGQIDGKTWSIPFQRSTIVLYWNKDLFREAGLDPDHGPDGQIRAGHHPGREAGIGAEPVGGHVGDELQPVRATRLSGLRICRAQGDDFQQRAHGK